MSAHRIVTATVAAMLMLGSSGCATLSTPFQSSEAASERDQIVTVLVENEGFTAFAVYSDTSPTRLGTVDSGATECLELRVPGSQRLLARPPGGGETVSTPPFDPLSGRGWHWTLGSTAMVDALRLVPAEACRP